ncbi:hypothetical protein TNCV_2876101 [Trichonephila clavipes]|nr:hypothetical protein TNCV_2876101 [Trichonephila clavipes]
MFYIKEYEGESENKFPLSTVVRVMYESTKYIETFVIPFDKLKKNLARKLRALHTEEAFTFAWAFCRLEPLKLHSTVTRCSELKEAIRKKLSGLLKSGILLLDNNERPHSVTAPQNRIATCLLGVRTPSTKQS